MLYVANPTVANARVRNTIGYATRAGVAKRIARSHPSTTARLLSAFRTLPPAASAAKQAKGTARISRSYSAQRRALRERCQPNTTRPGNAAPDYRQQTIETAAPSRRAAKGSH